MVGKGQPSTPSLCPPVLSCKVGTHRKPSSDGRHEHCLNCAVGGWFLARSRTKNTELIVLGGTGSSAQVADRRVVPSPPNASLRSDG